jgi:hypothetical protein
MESGDCGSGGNNVQFSNIFDTNPEQLPGTDVRLCFLVNEL